MIELLFLLFLLFIVFGIIRFIQVIHRLLLAYLKGEIKLTKEDKQQMKQSLRDGIMMILRRLYLFK